MNIRGENRRLPACAKGKTYDLLIPIKKNGVTYPNFSQFQASGWSIAGKVRKNNEDGAVVTSTWTISDATNAIVQVVIASDVTAALDCEVLVYELEGINANVSPSYVYGLIKGSIPVLPEVTY